MREIKRYLPELHPGKIKDNINRFWRIYINPPKERNVYLRPASLLTIASKVDTTPTKGQPKQVVYDQSTNLAYVSCMSGHALQIFRIEAEKIKLEGEVPFEDQCVEVLLNSGRVLVTTTNFDRLPHQLRNKFWVLDPNTREIVSSLDTGGNWSKLMAASPKGDEVLLSNWHSHNISAIDLKNPADPKLSQILSWGEAPRGIAFTPFGNQAIVTGFYSGNLGILAKDPESKQWASVYTSEPFDPPHYHGNMRHVLIDIDGENAIVSNLGRNLIHIWSIRDRKFTASIPVGKSPNSIDWINNHEIVVSCRDSNYVYRVDLRSQTVIGKSQRTGQEPTGLCSIKGGFLVTGFKSNTLELYKFT